MPSAATAGVRGAAATAWCGARRCRPRSAKTARLRIIAWRRPLLHDRRTNPHRAALPIRRRRRVATIELRRRTPSGCSDPVNRFTKPIPSVRTGRRVPCRLAETPARHLLHPSLLLFEAGVFHARRLHVAGEGLRSRLRESSAHRSIGQTQAGSIGRHRQRAVHQTSRLQLRPIQRRELSAAPESRRVASNGAARNPRIAKRIVDVHIVNDGGMVSESAAAESAIEAASPPGMERFKRRERHPAQAAKSKSHPNPEAASESEEADVRRRPKRIPQNGSGIPIPATHAPEPAAVMIRRPAPRIGSSPRSIHSSLPRPSGHFDRAPNPGRPYGCQTEP